MSYEVFAAFFRLSGTGFQFAILAIVLVTAVFVSRPFCSWVCPVDTTEHIARYVRVRALRAPGARGRPASPAPTDPPEGRCRAAAARARSSAGCATVSSPRPASSARLLVLGHFHERLSAQGRGAQEGLLGRTFVSIVGNR